MKFRKKPVVIEAFLFEGQPSDKWPEWLRQDNVFRHGKGAYLRIQTLEGDMIASFGDWIIKGVKGELYPCKPDIFEATYEKVN